MNICHRPLASSFRTTTIFTVGVLLTTALLYHATSVSWTGATDGNWATSTNWLTSPAALPA
jgi:hypothetical protein